MLGGCLLNAVAFCFLLQLTYGSVRSGAGWLNLQPQRGTTTIPKLNPTAKVRDLHVEHSTCARGKTRSAGIGYSGYTCVHVYIYICMYILTRILRCICIYSHIDTCIYVYTTHDIVYNVQYVLNLCCIIINI